MALRLPIYLDNNATTSCDPRVVDAMLPFFTQHFGNAGSKSHSFGWSAEEAVEMAREQVAQLINASPSEIVFTSGATESDNLALKGVYEMYAAKGNHIITIATEHSAVLDTCRHLEKLGAEITYLPVDEDGLIDLSNLELAIKDTTVLIAAMYGNNETGVIQPIKDISTIARKHKVLFFTDATQAIGKVPVDVQSDCIDLMAFSAHKIYGPKGVGALYVRRKDPRVRLAAQAHGGRQEKGIRSGTLNVPGIVGFGKACALCLEEMAAENERLNILRNKLETALLQLGDVYVNGSTRYRLNHVTNMRFAHVDARQLIAEMSKNIAVSGGSACTSASLAPSHVLKAMGLSDELAYSAIRFALGRFNTEEEVDHAILIVKDAVASIRKTSLMNSEH